MHPVLFEVGGTAVHTYGVLGATGFLVVCAVALLRGHRMGIAPETLADLIFFTALVSLAGARGLFVWQNPEGIDGAWAVVNYRTGGLVFYGALLAGIPFGTAWMRWKGLPILATWDLFATALPLGHGFARAGCFFAGCCWGRPTATPWAVRFSDPLAPAPHGVGLHPVQLYEAGALFVLGAILNLAWSRRRFDGQILGAYLVGYAAVRAVTELYRGDPGRGSFLPELLGTALSYSQGVSLGVAALGLALLAWGARSAGGGRG